jgi:hypothetical protein
LPHDARTRPLSKQLDGPTAVVVAVEMWATRRVVQAPAPGRSAISTASPSPPNRTAEYSCHATLIEYAGAPHGLPDTHNDRFHADVLAFLGA